MNVFVFILWVVIVVTLGRIVRAWMASKASQTSQPDPELNREMAQLKERVAALERIVTDSEYQLKKDFEKL